MSLPAPLVPHSTADDAAFARLGDAVSDPVLLADGGLVVTHANPAAARLFGRPRAALLHRRLEELVPTESRTALHAAAERVGSFVVDPELAGSHPLAGRRCHVQRVGGTVTIVVAPDVVPSISDFVRQLNQTLEFERIVDLVAAQAIDLLQARRANVFMIEGDALVVVGAAGVESLPAGTRLPLSSSFAGAAVRALRPIRLVDARSTAERWTLLADVLAGDPRPNALGAPLVIGGRAIGVVCVAGRDDADFDAADERLLAKLADHAAVAAENARLYAAAARTARHASILAETAREIAHHVSPQALYAGVARVARHALRADGVCIYLADATTGHAAVAHRAGEDCPDAACPNARALAGGEGWSARRFWADATGTVARTGAPHFATTATDALALLPLAVEGGARGVLALHYARPVVFDEDERRLLGDFATQTGAALERGRLFALQQRERELSEASAELARLALEYGNPTEVSSALLAVVDRVVPTRGKVLAAVVDPTTVEYLAGTGVTAALVGQRIPFPESIVARLQTRDDLVVDDVRSIVAPQYRERIPELRAVFVPLVARQRVIGMLGAGTLRDEPLGADATAELHRLAASVALALDALLLAAEERRRTARERELAAALATMDQPVLVVGMDGLVRYANLAAIREYGYPLAELTGLHVSRLSSTNGHPTPAWGSAIVPEGPVRAVGRRSSGMVRIAETVHQRADGSEFPVTVTRGTIRDEQGAAVGQVLGVRNLTEERRVAEQLRQHEKLAALGSLVAGVAHELNNPLTGISAFSQLLLEEGLDEEQRESVRLIKREADRAVAVIGDLLLFARKTGTAHVEVDLNALLQLAVRLRTYSLRTERITVAFELDPTAPRTMGDEQRLQQVFLNLLVNAEHAMEGAAERRLTLRTRVTGAHLQVEVRDTGRGMGPETLDHVFEPFFTTKPAGSGTGLGLSVSYGIIQAHGGAITAESAPGLGTTFRITLPLVVSGESSEQACP